MGRYGCRSYKAEKYAASVNKTFAKYIRTFYARIRVNSPSNQKLMFRGLLIMMGCWVHVE